MNAAAFLHIVYGDAARGNVILGFKLPGKKVKTLTTVPVDVARLDLAAVAIEGRRDRYESYFAPAVFAGERRLESQVLYSKWAALDRDDLPLDRDIPPPTLTLITSPNRKQDLWQMTEPLDRAGTKALQRRIARANGNGMQAVDAAHLFRVVGTPNHFRGGYLVEVEEYRPEYVYSPRAFDHLQTAPLSLSSPVDAPTGTANGLVIWRRTKPLLSPRMTALANGEDVAKQDGTPYATPSEGDEGLFTALINAGLTDEETEAAFMATARGHDMAARHGKDTLRRIRLGIGNARALIDAHPAIGKTTRQHIRLDTEIFDRLGARLGVYGLSVYMALLRRDNPGHQCYPSQERIAKELGISRKKVNEVIDEIARLGLMSIEERPGTRSNNYVLIHPDEIDFTSLPM